MRGSGVETTEFGIWAMIVFWGSAVGGIVFAISWARTKGRNPVNQELLLKSLKERLERGEIEEEEYHRRVARIESSERGKETARK